MQNQTPIFGIISIIAPFVGAILGFLFAITHATGEAGLAAPFFGVAITSIVTLIGSILAIIGIRRKEKPAVLLWISLVINAPLPLYFLTCVLDYR